MIDGLQRDVVVTDGPLFDEPVEVLLVASLGDSLRLTATDLTRLTCLPRKVVVNR